MIIFMYENRRRFNSEIFFSTSWRLFLFSFPSVSLRKNFQEFIFTATSHRFMLMVNLREEAEPAGSAPAPDQGSFSWFPPPFLFPLAACCYEADPSSSVRWDHREDNALTGGCSCFSTACNWVRNQADSVMKH